MSKAQYIVSHIENLKSQIDTIESMQCSMRLGSKLRRGKFIRWLDRCSGNDYDKIKLSIDETDLFYRFLSQKLNELREELYKIESELEKTEIEHE